MRIQIDTFNGELPKLHRSKLPEGAAQTATSVDVSQGTLRPHHDDRLQLAADPGAADIYLHKGETWVQFDEKVDVAPGAVPGSSDRLYITKETGKPKLMVFPAETLEDLALPIPSAPPLTSIHTPAPAPEEGDVLPTETVLFVYTWVSIYDEESLPSPASTALDVDEGATVSVTFPEQPPSGSRIDRLRVYRSATSSLGATELYFLTELNAATLEYVYDAEVDLLQELLPSSNYDQPDDEMRGLTPMQQGMMAGFKGKTLYFCEPYRPHAWPTAYELITDYDIVALATFGPMLAVLTTGHPYVCQGTHPDEMIMERIEQNAPCVSKEGVVDLGYAAAYPSTDGLIMLSTSGAQNVTEAILSRTQWRQLAPETIDAGNRGGAYVFTHDPDGDGNVQTKIITMGGSPSIISHPAAAKTFRYDVHTGNLYYLSDGGQIMEFASAEEGYQALNWKSGEVQLTTLTSFAGDPH